MVYDGDMPDEDDRVFYEVSLSEEDSFLVNWQPQAFPKDSQSHYGRSNDGDFRQRILIARVYPKMAHSFSLHLFPSKLHLESQYRRKDHFNVFPE